MQVEKKRIRYISAVLVLLMLAGCGQTTKIEGGRYYYTGADDSGGEQEEVQQEEQQEEEAESTGGEVTQDLFLIIRNEMQAESLILEQLSTGKQYLYYYSLSTSFLDKYGNHAVISSFEPGRVVTIGGKDTEGRLKQLQISDEVWEYPDIVRFSVDAERGIFYIADTKYAYDSNLYINSDGEALWLSDLDPMDEIRVVGIGKKLISVSVTSGHGELELQNTELFDGSYIQIGNEIFSEITENMTMELPEGTYSVTVANNGYGGSTDVTIERGQTTVLDLDELKGEGPKYGDILFAIDVQGATLYLDGKETDYVEPVHLKYGLHTLTVMADSYSTYSKRLFVNSQEATIIIALSGESAVSTADATTDAADETAEEGVAGSLAGSLAGSSGTGTSSDSSSTSALDAATIDTVVNELLNSDSSSSSSTDYISTLSELLSTITGSD
jgi:hypothetical protein